MSSYNGHSLFALILSLFYFLNPIYCLLTIVGANMSDFDHDVKKTELYKITIFGLIVFIILYVLKSSYFIGVLILLMVIMFYFSNHRGFTHSLVGGLILTSLIFAVIFFSMELSYQIPSDLNINFPAIFLDLISVLLCILFVNKKISYMIIGFFVLWTLMFPVAMINFELVAFSIFLGFLSHITLDSFSPAGVKLLNPFSSKKFGRKFSIFMTFLLILIAIIYKVPHYLI